jgi:fused signal recognition particle receptor
VPAFVDPNPLAVTRLTPRAGDLPVRSLWQRLKDVARLDVAALVQPSRIAGSLEVLEMLLLEADFGVPVSVRLVAAVEQRARRGEVKSDEEFRAALAEEIERALLAGRSDPALRFAAGGPTIILVAGVNGSGKTTTIGKLAARIAGEGRSVLLAAGDTYRAGAIAQLQLWAERTGSQFVGASAGGDPAAVAYAAVDAAVARGVDVVIVDTAGRLHTQTDLMTELKKVATVVAKRLPGAPHETLLVLDGTIGQNAVAQAKAFAGAVPVSGVVVTKVDGTARGGIVLAVHEALDVPVKFVGVGEQAGDLEPFDAAAYAAGLMRAE